MNMFEAYKEIIKSHQEKRKIIFDSISKMEEERKRMDVMEYSEHQLKDFANWCIRETNCEHGIFETWVKVGPQFLFEEWKNNRNKTK
jgi:hypothetical protein